MPTYRRNFSMLTVLAQCHGLQVLEDAAKLKNVAAASGLGVAAVTAAATQLRPLQSLDTCQGDGGAALWPAEMQAVLDQGAAMLSTALPRAAAPAVPPELQVATVAAWAAGAGPACGPTLLGGGAAAAGGSAGLGLPISGSVALAEAATGAAGTEAADGMQPPRQIDFSLLLSPAPSLSLNLEGLMSQAPANPRKRPHPGS